MDMATPSERRGLFPWVTGQGSRCSSPNRSVRFMSIFCTGCRNLKWEPRTESRSGQQAVVLRRHILKELEGQIQDQD